MLFSSIIFITIHGHLLLASFDSVESITTAVHSAREIQFHRADLFQDLYDPVPVDPVDPVDLIRAALAAPFLSCWIPA